MSVSFEIPPAHPRKSWKRYLLGFLSVGAILTLLSLMAFSDDFRRALSDATRGMRGGSTSGLLLAYAGLLMIVGAQFYTIVKRVGDPVLLHKLGGPRLWLDIHIALSALGVVFVLVHAGFPYRYRADLFDLGFAGLATWLLIVTTASGVFGRYLYSGLPGLKRVFSYWKTSHLITTASFFLFAIVHMVAMIR